MAVSKAEITMKFANLGVEDGMVYSKADLVQYIRVGDNHVVNFYQLDYTALAAAASRGGGTITEPPPSSILPLAKIVMDPRTFRRMVAALNQAGKDTEDSPKGE